ncbi:MAG: RNA 2',3'-cyclic phosphodiesterase [Candidatus Woesearchaeota archaeon]
MRLFIAIDFPLTNEIIKLQKEIQKITKASIPKTLHLTLKFLGYVSDSNLNKIINMLKKITFSEFELKTKEINAFPDINKINIVYLEIQENKELLNLKKEIDLNLIEFKDNYIFKPHITIARTEHNKKLIAFIKEENKKIDKINENLITSIKVNSFKLYKSELTNFGPIYTLINEFKEKNKAE